MPADPVVKLLKQSSMSFVGTVERLGAATMTDVPVDNHTAVVRVDQMLHAPDAFASLAGAPITVQLAAKAPLPKEGEQLTFFANGLAFGSSIAVTEVGRLSASEVAPHMARAAQTGAGAFSDAIAEVESEQFRMHAKSAQAVILGRVTALEKAEDSLALEHDADWWIATVDAYQVAKGPLKPGEIEVLYANSLDIRWHTAPKPKAGQEGLFILHATDRTLSGLAKYQIVHPEDLQPVQNLSALTTNGKIK
jgi:hypothetical protein